MDNIHVIVISSVRPEPTSAGQIILCRHLVDQPGITMEVHGGELLRPSFSRLIRRIAGRFGRTCLHRLVEDFWILWDGRWIDPELPTRIKDPARTIVLTVAHGDGFMAARRYAKRHHLPLLAFFQDWWPDIAQIHSPFRSILERKFRDLHQEAHTAICVCHGMAAELGQSGNSLVIYPLPANQEARRSISGDAHPFNVLCSGNFGDYGAMLGEALEASLAHPEILVQVRGANPNWPEERKTKMRANGRWVDFSPRAEFEEWLASADAFLIPMVFDPGIRRRMETSFPSKLIEFAQFGKPLIVWGPDYCSAVRWARDGDKAICVTDPDPAAAIRALMALSRNPSEISRYTGQSRRASQAEFNPQAIQKEFRSLLEVTLHRETLN